MYTAERDTSSIYSGNKGSWSGKVALLYPSDYGYSVNSAYWDVTTGYNSYDAAQDDGVIPAETSWMQMGANHTTYEWLLSPSSFDASGAVNWYTSGYVDYGIVYDYYIGVRPCLYLVSSAKILQGTGESSSPYVVIS